MKTFFLKFSRSLSSKLPSPKTTVLLVHNGLPKSLYYAKDFLSNELIEIHKFPPFLAKFGIDKYVDNSKCIFKCMEDYTKCEEISNYFDKLSKNIEDKLTETASFGSPYKVEYSFNFPISDKDYSIENTLMNMISKNGTQRFVVLPLHPIYDNKTNVNFKKKIDKFLDSHTEILDDEYTNLKVAKNFPVSFDYSFINEWYDKDFIINYWFEKLGKICNNIEESPDMILFTIPYVDIPGDKKDKEEFDKNYKNLCGEVIKKLGFPSSWRSTYYNTWDSLLSFNIFDKSNLIYSIKEHQKKGKQSIYIVPILDLLPSFNTATIIPNVSIQKNVKFLKPSNDVEFLSKHFTEIIERELLN